MDTRRIILLISLLLSGWLSGCSGNGSPGMPLANGGLIDLRRQSFASGIALNGEWHFYWDRLIDPHNNNPGEGRLVKFPSLWTSYSENGETLPSYGYATYTLTVLLPKHHLPLRMTMPDVYCSYLLFINGEKAAGNGRVSKTKAGFVPHWQYKAVDVPAHVDTLRLMLQVSNFVHSKGGVKESIVIGQKAKVVLNRQRAEAIDMVLTGCLFMGGLFFLGLYLLGNRDRAILLFSMYSIIYSYRVIGIENYVLHTLLPDLSWYVTVRLEYTSLFLGIGLFSLYTWCLYPESVNKWLVRFLVGICFGFAACSTFLPPILFTRLINPFLLVMALALVYIPYVYLQAYRKREPGSLFALLSIISLSLVFAISLFHYWGFIPPLQLLSFFCYISFFFLQSLILSHRVSFVLKKARMQAEQGLIAKSEFLSTMSHEIRTPLNSVIGMSHLLLKNKPRPDQVEQLDVMLFSANNLLSIVNDILDYNKIEAGKISFEHIEMDVAAIVRNIVIGMQISAQDKGIQLNLRVDDALTTRLIGDPTRLSQVITNLVHNAIKFTPKGAVEVGVEVSAQTATDITLLFRVKDTGIGISKEKQKLIFERFTQADSSTSRGFGGTGLGLAISKRILELQGSVLELVSEEDKGSLFFFAQTFVKSNNVLEYRNLEQLPKEEDKPLTGIPVLLVEDNPMNVMVAQSYLKRWGATIDVASNGQEALSMLDVNKHKLILMDLHMPVMDGYESARKMRARGVTIPIIALTANLPNEVETALAEAGMNDMVTKPFLPDELYRKILHHIFMNER